MRIPPILRTARKIHRCEGHGDHRPHTINPGDQYWRMVLAPWEDVNSSDLFWPLKICREGRTI